MDKTLEQILKELGQDKEVIRDALYANSPWDLASIPDDLYRDAIDQVLDK